MTNIYYVLHYLMRFFILFIFSLVMGVTVDAPIFIQLLVIAVIIIYFSMEDLQLENILFEFDVEYIFEEKIFKVISIFAKVIITFGYLYLLLSGFYAIVVFIFIVDLIVKIIFSTSIEEIFVNERIYIKEQDASKV